MITAEEARGVGPIAEYIAVSHALQNQIWKAIYRREQTVYFSNTYALAGVVYNTTTEWHQRLVSELQALGYEVQGDEIRW